MAAEDARNSRRKKANSKEFAPNNKLYLALLLGAILLTSASICFKDNKVVFTICTSITCGGIASIIVAWLLDVANCREKNVKTNRNTKAIYDRIFNCFETGIQSFTWLIDLSGETIDENTERTWDGWIIHAFDRIGNNTDFLFRFCSGFCVFTDSLAAEVKAVYNQSAQLLDVQILSSDELKTLATILDICAMTKQDFSLNGVSIQLAERYRQNCGIMKKALSESIILSQINEKQIGSNLHRVLTKLVNAE